MPGNENTKSGILQGLFICRTSELNPRGIIQPEFKRKDVQIIRKPEVTEPGRAKHTAHDHREHPFS